MGYIIYRNGSNAANQSMCDKMPVAIEWDAETSEEAIQSVIDSELFETYANQYFSAEETEDFEGTDDDFSSLQEEIQFLEERAKANYEYVSSLYGEKQ